MSFATTAEIQQYARMTFKQYGFPDYSLEFNPKLKRTLGLADPWNKRIILSLKALSSFALFKKVLLHEIAHCKQLPLMGGNFKVNGRHNFHGKIFKQVCREMGISSSTFI